MGAYISKSDLEELELGLYSNKNKEEVCCVYILFPILLLMFYLYILIVNSQPT